VVFSIDPDPGLRKTLNDWHNFIVMQWLHLINSKKPAAF
jgi:hypothetical protein